MPNKKKTKDFVRISIPLATEKADSIKQLAHRMSINENKLVSTSELIRRAIDSYYYDAVAILEEKIS